MQLFLLPKAPFLPVSNGSNLTSNPHNLGYALCSMLYGFWLLLLLLSTLRWMLDASQVSGPGTERTKLVLRLRSPPGGRFSLSSQHIAHRNCSVLAPCSACGFCARSLGLCPASFLCYARLAVRWHWLCVLLSIGAG